MGNAQQDTRRYPRVIVGGRTKGWITPLYEAALLNISLGGALMEHTEAVRPGTISPLDLDLPMKRVGLRCRVVRSVVHRSEVQPDGGRELIYHTGLEFLDPSNETAQAVSEYIQSIIEDGNEKRPKEEEVREQLFRELEELDGLVNGARRVLGEGLNQIAPRHR